MKKTLTKAEKTLMYKLQYIARGGAEGARLRQKKWRDKKNFIKKIAELEKKSQAVQRLLDAKNKTTNLHRKK